MKEFNLEHVFIMSEILDKMDLKVEAERLSKTVNTQKLEGVEDATKLGKEIIVAIGIEIMTKAVASMHKAQKEIIKLIVSLTDKSMEEAKSMKLSELKQFFDDLAKNEGFADFFK